MTSSLTLSPDESSPDESSGLSDRTNRVRPGAEHIVDERIILGVEGEREASRVEAVLETVESIDPEAMSEFEAMHSQSGMVKGSDQWRVIFDLSLIHI